MKDTTKKTAKNTPKNAKIEAPIESPTSEEDTTKKTAKNTPKNDSKNTPIATTSEEETTLGTAKIAGSKDISITAKGITFSSKAILKAFLPIAESFSIKLGEAFELEGKTAVKLLNRAKLRELRLAVRIAKGKDEIPFFKGEIAKYYRPSEPETSEA